MDKQHPRFTPNCINELKPNEVFVFGSTTNGQHDSSATRPALGWGAQIGKHEGLAGQTYAIPTMTFPDRIIPTHYIREGIETFIEFAKAHPDLTFLVTKIGFGSSHYKTQGISVLFNDVLNIPNIILPLDFIRSIATHRCALVYQKGVYKDREYA